MEKTGLLLTREAATKVANEIHFSPFATKYGIVAETKEASDPGYVHLSFRADSEFGEGVAFGMATMIFGYAF